MERPITFFSPSVAPSGAAFYRGSAVAPFRNLSPDSEHEYFAAGVVEDIVTALSRFRGFAVMVGETAAAVSDFWKCRAMLKGFFQRQDERM